MSRSRRKIFWLGLDIGGTKILAALLDKNFKIHGEIKVRVEPDRGRDFFFKTIHGAVKDLLEETGVKPKQIRGAGAGCPGIIHNPEGVVRLSPNLPFLKNCKLRKILSALFDCPAVVENDVNAGLYGEQQFGAARGFKHVAGIFLGTGVGGAFIFDGKIYRGLTGAAGEIGHTYLFPPLGLSDPAKATVEGAFGRLAISAEAGLLLMQQKAPALFQNTGYDVRKIKSKTLLKAIRSGDTALKSLIVEKARLLGVTMANLVNLLSPELIVLGGGLMEALGSLILPAARQTLRELAMVPLVKPVRVAAAELKDYAIVKGAAKLASEQV